MSPVMKMYSVRDAKADYYNQPVLAHTHGEAERNFKKVVNSQSEQNLIYQYPEDYDLYYLGEFELKTGKMELLDSPQHMVKGVQLKDPVQ